MTINLKYFYYLFAFIFCISGVNASSNITLNKTTINLENYTSLQKGAKVFLENCQGCHGLKYMRYSDLAIGLNLNENREKSLDQVIKEKLMHSIQGINENSPILSSIDKEKAVKWFGKLPPDLSLVARYRSPNWIFTYMKSFYKDDARPFGVNNLLFPDVGMPHILLKYQGIQILKNNIDLHEKNIENMLELIENGELSKDEYDNLVTDLTAFLSYVGEPIQVERQNIGTLVLFFLIVLTIILFLLKKEFWKDIK